MGLCWLVQPVSAQFIDDFSDSSWQTPVHWLGDTLLFTTNQGLLRLQAPASSGSAQLFTSSNVQENARFSGYVEMQFNPSSANYLDYYLIADRDSLHLPLNGLFLRFGHTNDELSLFKQQGTIKTKVIDGPDGMFNYNLNRCLFQIDRDSNGLWTLQIDTTAGGQHWYLIGSWPDSSRYNAQFSGLRCIYSATRSDKFLFDDLQASGQAWQDRSPPAVVSHAFIPPYTLEIEFDEPIDSLSTAAQFINSNNGLAALELLQLDALRYSLEFGQPFQADSSYTIQLQQISDAAGNRLDTHLIVRWHDPFVGEIIINEVMADPLPTVGLAAYEYVELYNRSAYTLNLADYLWSDAGTQIGLPAFEMPSNSYVVLCPAAAQAEFSLFGTALGLSNWPSLNNDTDQLKLHSKNGRLIDSLSYSSSWWNDVEKAAGGWSLERIDADYFCLDQANWSASNNPAGGTPGNTNSIAATLIDTLHPTLAYFKQSYPDSIWLIFNRPLHKLPTYTVRFDDQQYPISGIQGDTSTIWLLNIPIDNQLRTLQIAGMAACNGAILSDTSIQLAWPEQAATGDWRITEICFQPKSNQAAFIELYNASSKLLSLHELLLANQDVGQGIPLSSGIQIVQPGEWLCLSRSVGGVKSDYPIHGKKFHQLNRWPSMPQAGGEIRLYRADGALLDQINYHPDMHHQLLQQTKGVSLELVQLNGKPQWHSAATPPGGTPALANSQQQPEVTQNKQVFSFEPRIFSPNQDGRDDLLGICWQDQAPGGLLNIYIFNSQGSMIRHLVNQAVAASDDCVYWDGTTDSGQLAGSGRYLIRCELFWLDGKRVSKQHMVGLNGINN
jgi:hypothetical protein